MQTNNKDSKLSDRLNEALEQVRNLQRDVTERDDSIKSLKHDFQHKEHYLKDKIKRLNDALNESNQAQFKLQQQHEIKMKEKDAFIYITSKEKKLVETKLEFEQRQNQLNDLYAMHNNFNTTEHCHVTQCERIRQAYNRIKAENQELQERMTALEENISRLYSQIETLERSEKAHDNYIQQMPTNSSPIVHNRWCNDHEKNPPSIAFDTFCGCVRNAHYHWFRAGGSSNCCYPCGNCCCLKINHCARSISNGGTPESTVELLPRPVSTAEISRQSSSSGIGTDTTDASDGSSHSRKRRVFVVYADEQSSSAKKFAADIAQPIDSPTLNVSTLPQSEIESPSTNGEQKTDRENNGDISDHSNPPRDENTIISYHVSRLLMSESNQRTPAENEKPTVETLPVIVIDDSTIADQDGVASSTRKMSVDDVDMYSGFNANAGPSSSSGDESDSESDCSGEDMPPPEKQGQKKGETPDPQKDNTTVPVIPRGKITKRTRSKPVVPQ